MTTLLIKHLKLNCVRVSEALTRAARPPVAAYIYHLTSDEMVDFTF